VRVGVLKGPYKGDLGVVVDVVGSSATVSLEHFGEKSQPKSFLIVIDSSESLRMFTSRYPRPKKTSTGASESQEKQRVASKIVHPTRSTNDRRYNEKISSRKNDNKKKKKRRRDDEESSSGLCVKKSRRLWVRPQLRVRLIGSKYYREKGRIMDVLDPIDGDCVIRLERSGRVVECVKQRDLETVLPRDGGELMIVQGSHRGKRGRLLKLRKRNDTAIVQLHVDSSVLELHMDDVSQYLEPADTD